MLLQWYPLCHLHVLKSSLTSPFYVHPQLPTLFSLLNISCPIGSLVSINKMEEQSWFCIYKLANYTAVCQNYIGSYLWKTKAYFSSLKSVSNIIFIYQEAQNNSGIRLSQGISWSHYSLSFIYFYWKYHHFTLPLTVLGHVRTSSTIPWNLFTFSGDAFASEIFNLWF